jgi:MOSC domain-containing protein YiiM
MNAIGAVESIHVTAEREQPAHPVESVEAVAGKGLEGDRYFTGEGTYSHKPEPGRELTLIEAEAIEGLAREHGIELRPGEARRNVVTRGIGLNDLVGRRFTVGEVECVGTELCHPCSHLQKLTRPGVLKGLANRGGLRADIVSGGQISVGDAVSDLGPA